LPTTRDRASLKASKALPSEANRNTDARQNPTHCAVDYAFIDRLLPRYVGEFEVSPDFITPDFGIYVGIAQLAIVLMFAIGYKRTVFYGLMMAMHAVGVFGAVGGILNYTRYPNNLLLTAVPTLGALIALFLLRRHDLWTVDGQFGKKS